MKKQKFSSCTVSVYKQLEIGEGIVGVLSEGTGHEGGTWADHPHLRQDYIAEFGLGNTPEGVLKAGDLQTLAQQIIHNYLIFEHQLPRPVARAESPIEKVYHYKRLHLRYETPGEQGFFLAGRLRDGRISYYDCVNLVPAEQKNLQQSLWQQWLRATTNMVMEGTQKWPKKK